MKKQTTKIQRGKILLIAMALVIVSCSGSSTPKPYGYYRLELPAHEYTTIDHSANAIQHSAFLINKAACITPADSANRDYFNICYPTLNATIHCSYLPIRGNLPALLKDAQDIVYSHAVKASAIPEQEYTNDEYKVYGMLYELQGNTATPAQFYLTDSTRHFFRAAVYINTIPNQDSLAPVIDYLISDVRQMMESFRWNKE